LQIQLDEKDDPLTYLRLFLDDSPTDVTVNKTNHYTEQTLTRTRHRRLSCTQHCEPVTKDNIWRLFGVLVLQGLVYKPRQQQYWSQNRLLVMPVFQDVMSEYKFSLIMKFLHVTNNDDFNARKHPAPKLKKIWEIYQALISNFQKAYSIHLVVTSVLTEV